MQPRLYGFILKRLADRDQTLRGSPTSKPRNLAKSCRLQARYKFRGLDLHNCPISGHGVEKKPMQETG